MALNISKKTSPADVDSSAKGDLIVNNGNDIVSLPVGSNGFILAANSATSRGIQWISQPLDGIIDGTYTPTPAASNYPPQPAGSFEDIINALTIAGGGNPHTSGSIEIFRDNPGSPQGAINTGLGITNPESLVDQNLGAPTPSGLTANTFQSYLIDFKSNNVKVTHIRMYGENTPAAAFPALILTSNTGAASSWTNNGPGAGAPQNGSWGSLFTLSSPQFARYLRIVFNLGGGQGTPGILGEVELFGEATINGLNNYNLDSNWNNKYIEFTSIGNHVININVDTSTLIGNKFITLIKNGTTASTVTFNTLSLATIQGKTLLNPGEAVFLIKIATNTYFVSPVPGDKLTTKGDLLTYSTEEVALPVGTNGQLLSANSATNTGLEWINTEDSLPLTAKGDLLSHDGSELIVQNIGANNTVLVADSGQASGIAWKNVNSLTTSPFTSQRINLSGTLQLTASNARYLYLDPQGNTYDVVLTNPPSTNDFFYIVNRTGNGVIQIKEIATGGVVQLLNSNTPVAQCHWDSVEWQIISYGNI